ncbi:hypothetical protein I7I53_01121 [Histoplasma capsulatum var. duboisii H88]|uniref:Uncharacterized protein n=1 Tax=Ajellomyces capsulatus (strain H88) TaxID=544711 RepID=A0A8A1LJX5_AJEC8|nr:hypothetical protein I7I53_01121 [Histoplasma capsulatum var. duboisii H88]
MQMHISSLRAIFDKLENGAGFLPLCTFYREKLSWRCRPGKDLFNGSASSLVSLLRDPLSPNFMMGRTEQSYLSQRKLFLRKGALSPTVFLLLCHLPVL